MSLNQNFTSKAKTTYKATRFIYLLLVHLLLLYYSPFITVTNEDKTTMLNIDFPFYKKDVLITE